MKVGATTNYFVKIDNGPWTSYIGVTGTVDLTPTPLASGTHVISIAQGKDNQYVFKFEGLLLDAGATTSAPPVGTDIIEFIGDSITAGFTNPQANVSDYAWVCAENMNAEHTQIAFPGIALTDGYGLATNKIGMEIQYFKEKSIAYPTSPAWDFTRYTPKIIVINIGQNDNGTGVPDTTFQRKYIDFLAAVRAQLPNTYIFVMRTFLGVKAAPTLAAVTARIAAGDTRLHYIDTNGWLTPNSADYTNNAGAHPSVSGHIKAANLLQPILAPYLTGGTQVIPNGTYKIISKNGGLALDVKSNLTANGSLIQQWAYSGGTNQRWTVTHIGNGRYKIIGVQSNRAIDVPANATADGTTVQIYDQNGGRNQLWYINPVPGGYFEIQGVGSSKLLEIQGNVTTPGALAGIYSDRNGNNQQWTFQTP
jgi:hypothetical protein